MSSVQPRDGSASSSSSTSVSGPNVHVTEDGKVTISEGGVVTTRQVTRLAGKEFVAGEKLNDTQRAKITAMITDLITEKEKDVGKQAITSLKRTDITKWAFKVDTTKKEKTIAHMVASTATATLAKLTFTLNLYSQYLASPSTQPPASEQETKSVGSVPTSIDTAVPAPNASTVAPLPVAQPVATSSSSSNASTVAPLSARVASSNTPSAPAATTQPSSTGAGSSSSAAPGPAPGKKTVERYSLKNHKTKKIDPAQEPDLVLGTTSAERKAIHSTAKDEEDNKYGNSTTSSTTATATQASTVPNSNIEESFSFTKFWASVSKSASDFYQKHIATKTQPTPAAAPATPATKMTADELRAWGEIDATMKKNALTSPDEIIQFLDRLTIGFDRNPESDRPLRTSLHRLLGEMFDIYKNQSSENLQKIKTKLQEVDATLQKLNKLPTLDQKAAKVLRGETVGEAVSPVTIRLANLLLYGTNKPLRTEQEKGLIDIVIPKQQNTLDRIKAFFTADKPDEKTLRKAFEDLQAVSKGLLKEINKDNLYRYPANINQELTKQSLQLKELLDNDPLPEDLLENLQKIHNLLRAAQNNIKNLNIDLSGDKEFVQCKNYIEALAKVHIPITGDFGTRFMALVNPNYFVKAAASTPTDFVATTTTLPAAKQEKVTATVTPPTPASPAKVESLKTPVSIPTAAPAPLSVAPPVIEPSSASSAMIDEMRVKDEKIAWDYIYAVLDRENFINAKNKIVDGRVQVKGEIDDDRVKEFIKGIHPHKSVTELGGYPKLLDLINDLNDLFNICKDKSSENLQRLKIVLEKLDKNYILSQGFEKEFERGASFRNPMSPKYYSTVFRQSESRRQIIDLLLGTKVSGERLPDGLMSTPIPEPLPPPKPLNFWERVQAGWTAAITSVKAAKKPADAPLVPSTPVPPVSTSALHAAPNETVRPQVASTPQHDETERKEKPRVHFPSNLTGERDSKYERNREYSDVSNTITSDGSVTEDTDTDDILVEVNLDDTSTPAATTLSQRPSISLAEGQERAVSDLLNSTPSTEERTEAVVTQALLPVVQQESNYDQQAAKPTQNLVEPTTGKAHAVKKALKGAAVDAITYLGAAILSVLGVVAAAIVSGVSFGVVPRKVYKYHKSKETLLAKEAHIMQYEENLSKFKTLQETRDKFINQNGTKISDNASMAEEIVGRAEDGKKEKVLTDSIKKMLEILASDLETSYGVTDVLESTLRKNQEFIAAYRVALTSDAYKSLKTSDPQHQAVEFLQKFALAIYRDVNVQANYQKLGAGILQNSSPSKAAEEKPEFLRENAPPPGDKELRRQLTEIRLKDDFSDFNVILEKSQHHVAQEMHENHGIISKITYAITHPKKALGSMAAEGETGYGSVQALTIAAAKIRKLGTSREEDAVSGNIEQGKYDSHGELGNNPSLHSIHQFILKHRAKHSVVQVRNINGGSPTIGDDTVSPEFYALLDAIKANRALPPGERDPEIPSAFIYTNLQDLAKPGGEGPRSEALMKLAESPEYRDCIVLNSLPKDSKFYKSADWVDAATFGSDMDTRMNDISSFKSSGRTHPDENDQSFYFGGPGTPEERQAKWSPILNHIIHNAIDHFNTSVTVPKHPNDKEKKELCLAFQEYVYSMIQDYMEAEVAKTLLEQGYSANIMCMSPCKEMVDRGAIENAKRMYLNLNKGIETEDPEETTKNKELILGVMHSRAIMANDRAILPDRAKAFYAFVSYVDPKTYQENREKLFQTLENLDVQKHTFQSAVDVGRSLEKGKKLDARDSVVVEGPLVVDVDSNVENSPPTPSTARTPSPFPDEQQL